MWKDIAWGGFLGGLLVGGIGAEFDSAPVARAGLSVMLVVPIVGIVGMVANRQSMKDDTKIVFKTYDQGLAERFNVCVNGLAMAACENNVPGAAPSEAVADPALRSLRQR